MAKDYLTFATGINFTKAMLQYINGLTFMYNPSWKPNTHSYSTLPIAFFHVKDMHEIMDSEVSTRPMLFYNSSGAFNTDTRNGIINTVSDNITLKPKQYQLDVLIPYKTFLAITHSPAINGQWTDVVEAASKGSLSNSGVTSSTISHLSDLSFSIPTFLSPTLQTVKVLLAALGIKDTSDMLSAAAQIDFSSVASGITGFMNTPDYNRGSLEAMWEDRAILKMKLWTGWKYKTVVMTHFDISKESEEEGVYEATITCQEIPIVTVNTERGKKVIPSKNLLEIAAAEIINIVDGFSTKSSS